MIENKILQKKSAFSKGEKHIKFLKTPETKKMLHKTFKLNFCYFEKEQVLMMKNAKKIQFLHEIKLLPFFTFFFNSRKDDIYVMWGGFLAFRYIFFIIISIFVHRKSVTLLFKNRG